MEVRTLYMYWQQLLGVHRKESNSAYTRGTAVPINRFEPLTSVSLRLLCAAIRRVHRPSFATVIGSGRYVSAICCGNHSAKCVRRRRAVAANVLTQPPVAAAMRERHRAYVCAPSDALCRRSTKCKQRTASTPEPLERCVRRTRAPVFHRGAAGGTCMRGNVRAETGNRQQHERSYTMPPNRAPITALKIGCAAVRDLGVPHRARARARMERA